MDFPVCPSCHQSVIDDDAVDCPFCGASMKGKAGSKPAPAAAKPGGATATAKPAPAKGGKTVGTKPTLPGDDFPFEAELTAGKPAIPAMPNPTKQRTLQVVCPMCDTQGYVPPNALGQDVRCANPKCVMPVFTVPLPKKVEEAPPPPPPKKSNLPLVGGVTFAVMALIGVGLYVFNSMPAGGGNPVAKGLSEEDKAELMSQSKPSAKIVVPGKMPGKEKGPANSDKKPVAEQPAGEDLVAAILKQLKEACLETTKQRSKPYCRQLAAEANAVTGNAEAAREHLVQLLRVGSSVSYYRITPLLDLFWFDFGKDPNQAVKSLNLAMSEVPQLPKSGASRLELTGKLATALVAAHRMPEALKLMEDYHSSDSDSQLEARLLMASEGKVGVLSTWYSVLPWKYPGSVAVTTCLISRGHLERAEKWAAAQSSDDGKSECLAIWAEEFARRKLPEGAADADGVIAGQVKALSPALAARVWARVACGRFLAKDAAGTAAVIKLAAELLASVQVPSELTMPVFKETERFKLPSATIALTQAATAAAELAFVQSYSGAKADAEKSLDLALSLIDATAPTLAAAEQRVNEMNRMGSKLRDQLKQEINKRMTDDQSHRAAANYKTALLEIASASRRRFETETQILSRLRSAGLDSKVWIVVNARSTADDINHRDDFFATDLPGELVEGLKGTIEERAILGAWQAKSNGSAPARPVAVDFNDNLKKDIPAAIAVLKSIPADSTLRKEIPLAAATRLASENQLSTAFQFISALPDGVLREDCYRLSAAIAAKRNQSEAVWKQVSVVTQATEKAALCRGIIAGLKAVDQPVEPLPQ